MFFFQLLLLQAINALLVWRIVFGRFCACFSITTGRCITARSTGGCVFLTTATEHEQQAQDGTTE